MVPGSVFCNVGGGDNCVECRRVGYGYFAEHFSVQSDVGFFEAVYKPAVHNAPLPAGGSQSCNPQGSEISFSQFSPDTCIDARPPSRLFCRTVKMAGGTSISLNRFKYAFMCPASCGAFSDSGHIRFPFSIRRFRLCANNESVSFRVNPGDNTRGGYLSPLLAVLAAHQVVTRWMLVSQLSFGGHFKPLGRSLVCLHLRHSK